MGFAPVLIDLATLLAVASTTGFLFQKLKQPAVMGYILAGALVGPLSPVSVLKFDLPSVHFWADLGIIFLMFYLGLEFSFRRMGRAGFKSLWIGAFEIAAMFGLGSLTAKLFLPGIVSPAFLGAMVAISSTTIIIKALDELPLRDRRPTEKAFPLLIIEDLAAVLLIVVLTSPSTDQEINDSHLLFLAAELLIVIGGWYLIGTFLLPRVLRFFEVKRELLTIAAIALCLLIATGAAALGYSLALGAFITGSVLAEMHELEKLRRAVRPLKDIFGAVFFVSIGMLVDPHALLPHAGLIVALSVFVVVGKAFCVTLGSLIAGESFSSSLRVGLAMGQIGEFSFIIAGLGVSAGLVSEEFRPVIVAVALITAFVTPYSMRAAPFISDWADQRIPNRFRAMGIGSRRAIFSALSTSRFPDWIRSLTLKFTINTILVTLFFGFVRRHLVTWLTNACLNGNEPLALMLTLSGAFLICAPLFFAMFTCGDRRRPLFPILTVVWTLFLGSLFIETWTDAAVAASLGIVISGILATAFRKNLANTYRWLETGFLSGLKPPGHDVSVLVPWNLHLSPLRLHPNARLAGRTLERSGLREDHGVSVIAMRRGDRLIAMPDKDECMMPNDELLLLGDDDQIERARALVENPVFDVGEAFGTHDLGNFEIRSFALAGGSRLVSRSIGDSRLREETGEWIVGVERDGEKLVSPAPDFSLREGDLVWTVGPRM